MEEPSSRSENDPKEREKEPWKYYSTYKYTPSGRLNLIIESYVGEGNKKTWADTDKHPVETRLNSFIVGLILAAEALKKTSIGKGRARQEVGGGGKKKGRTGRTAEARAT
jgi:hypothetical protein